MSDNTTNNNKNVRDDEIDLLDLFRRMGRTLSRWFSVLAKGFLISVVFLIRRWLPLGLSIIAGVVVSYVLRSTSTSFYSADLVLRNNLVQLDKKKLKDISGTTSELISKINKLHSLCSDKISLSKALMLSPESLKNISDISAFWIIDLNRDGIPDNVDYFGNHDVYDTINIRMPGRLDVRVNFNSSLDLDQIRIGILKFIESDSLNQERNRLRIKQNSDMLVRLNYDIQQLDSLQKVKYFEETRKLTPGKEGQIVLMQQPITQLVYNDIYNLYDKKQKLETEVLYKDVVTVLNDFSLPELKNNGTKYYGKQVIPIFFFVTLFILIVLANRKKLDEIYKKY